MSAYVYYKLQFFVFFGRGMGIRGGKNLKWSIQCDYVSAGDPWRGILRGRLTMVRINVENR